METISLCAYSIHFKFSFSKWDQCLTLNLSQGYLEDKKLKRDLQYGFQKKKSILYLTTLLLIRIRVPHFLKETSVFAIDKVVDRIWHKVFFFKFTILFLSERSAHFRSLLMALWASSLCLVVGK